MKKCSLCVREFNDCVLWKKDIDDDETNIDTVDPVGEVTDDTDTSPTRVTSVTLINDYIWEGLNQYYYWQDQVLSLPTTKLLM